MIARSGVETALDDTAAQAHRSQAVPSVNSLCDPCRLWESMQNHGVLLLVRG